VEDPGDLRHSGAVEVKWGVHAVGDKRTEWSPGEHDRTVLVLIEGRWRLELAEGEQRSNPQIIVLDAPGDYVVWGKRVDHRWHAEEDSVVITVRWPSLT
jgi:hypothetical protein